MNGWKQFALIGFPATLVILMGTGYLTDRAAADMPGFYAWKLLSGEAHGGQYITANNIRTYFETYGSGNPVLILHGGLGCIESMEHQIGALAGKHFVIAADSRGHGRSGDDREPLSYHLMADDMVSLLDVLKVQRTDVVGWSDGGIIALDLAMRYPERVRKIIAISANYDVGGLVNPAAAAESPPPPGICQRGQNAAQRLSIYLKVIKLWQTEPRYSLRDLAKIKAPTLIMAGEFDVVRRTHTYELAKAIAGAKEQIILGGTHSVILEKASIVNAGILSFLDDIPCPASQSDVKCQ